MSHAHAPQLDETHAPEDTLAYQVLKKHKLLDTKYRLQSAAQIDCVKANSNRWKNLLVNIVCFPFKPCGFFKTFEVPAGHVRPFTDGRGGFHFYGEGVHLVVDPFHSIEPPQSFGVNQIVHGDRSIIVIEQGKVGFALERGQPVLLPPGMHQWKNPTLVYRNAFDLNNNVIKMGPLTMVTVDEGYAGITEDNGKQVMLEGGQTYLLTHRNWKFQKFISLKIQSNAMKRIEATSADNVLMAVDATVIWRITNADIAAKNSAETISKTGADESGDNLGDISKLREDVLKQAEASLAAFVGAVQYSDTFNVAAAVQSATQPTPSRPADESHYSSPLFDLARLQTCVDHANAITQTYGVSIISINVVAAVPAAKDLQSSLAQGAVAAAEAQKFETVARGRAAALQVEAKGIAEAGITRAKGAADAELIRADGSRKAADLLASSEVAVRFAIVDKTGAAIGDKATFFFGSQVENLGELIAPGKKH